MKIIKCTKHNVEFQLATTEEEFLSGELHNEIMSIQEHIEKYPQCRMESI